MEGFARFLIGRDDEDGIVTSDGSGDFREFGAVNGGSKRLRAAGGRLQNEKIFRRPDIKKKFADGGNEAVGSTPAQFATAIASDMANIGKMIKATGMRAD